MRTTFAPQTWHDYAAEFIRRAALTLRAAPKARPTSKLLPAHRTPSEQWARVAGVLAEAQARAARALDSHRGASAQLDAATYALQRLHEEMGPAFLFTVTRPTPTPPAPTAFRSEPFRRREPIAA